MYYWKCRNDGCSVKLTTEPFDTENMNADITVIRSENHHHPVQQEKLDMVAAKNDIFFFPRTRDGLRRWYMAQTDGISDIRSTTSQLGIITPN